MIGFIPAGGTNERWGAGYKELLPISEGHWLLDNAIDCLLDAGCNRICIASSPTKIMVHHQHLLRLGYVKNVFFVMGGGTMWESIRNYLPHATDRTLMMMPDTLTEIPTFRPGNVDMTFGTFATEEPERFSIMQGETILTKPQNLAKGIYKAWGIVSWSREVSQFWAIQSGIKDYDLAFNLAMMRFPWTTLDLPYYHDIADWKSYRRYLSETFREDA